jgi:2-polyprenyl-6-methoxyphenol hydroxylase-like FAD-dependent oxidoreductase
LKHVPALRAFLDPAKFALASSLDHLMTAITPTVRRGYVHFLNGNYVTALGDTHVLMDPIIGQGANTASYAAWSLGEAIRDSDRFAQAWCQQIEQRILTDARAVFDLSNARLQPPPPHMIELMAAAAQHQPVADWHLSGFNHPQRMWEITHNPQRMQALLTELGWQGIPAAVVTT